ncbi:MAG: BtpA/SgcQ family protein, partial [Phycisphaerae bacterium]
MWGARVAILADVHVKHATPVDNTDIAAAARDTAYRGLADGLIVTGAATGDSADFDDLRAVREAVPDRRLFVGSGATTDNVAELMNLAGGIIVGTSLKQDGVTANPVDQQRAAAFARAAGRNV